MKTAKFVTLGCKVNQYDTQSIREAFLKNGFQESREGKNADFCVINTCTVTKDADQKSRNAIRNCIKDNPGSKIIVTGCLVRDAVSLRNIKGISYLISKRFFREGISSFSGRTRAFLKIQDGCDNFCSYCKVPLVRGRSRSRQLDVVVKEAEALTRKGFKEIVLTGICLGSFGRDLEPKTDLVGLIERFEKINGLLRIRLSSIESRDVSERLISKIASSKKLCRHLHIPLQSGDNEILRKMNRKYTRGDYLRLIKKIKKIVPGIALTTDILVGFPGENETNFGNTLSMVKRVLPLKTHIFPYSEREGTYAASNYKLKIEPAIVKKRIARLKAIADSCSIAYKKIFLGKEMPVLFESRSAENPCFWQGYTDNYLKVLVKSKADLKGKDTQVKLRKISGNHFLATRNKSARN